jgi:regulator of protease activity HflC (stomatin/prohibitin superfamily)
MTTSSKRPEHLAWVCLVLSLVFFGIAFLMGRWSGFLAVSVVAWQILAAALIWLVLAIQFHQRSRAEQEKLDMSQLARDKENATIFQGQGEQAALLATAQRRLDVLETWFLPIFAGLIAAYEIGIGLYALRGAAAQEQERTRQPLVAAVVMAAVAFVSFLLSRYATGMSAEPRWKPLRAGGSYLLGGALLCFAVALSLAGVHFQFFLPVKIVAYVVPILLIVLGLETALNVVLDIYRPRLKGQYSLAAFDSRLLGLINEPGGVFRSVAAAIDYQFGFQVSQTWFYKLLEKAIVPLILFSAATLYLASCIVVVAPDEEGIVERFGDPLTAGGEARTIGPGLHIKLPWPIDIVYTHPVKRVMELYVGYVPRVDPKTGEQIPERSLLWGQTHYAEEHTVLVASEQAADELGEGAAPVSLVKANLPVQYRVKDLYAYTYNHDEPDKLLEAICYRELTRFAANATVEVASIGAAAAQDRDSLFGAGRARAREVLAERIQAAADGRGLGIHVTFVGVQGIHPPPEVAPDYQAVIGAIQQKQALVLTAEAERNRALSTLIGSVRKAYELADWARQYQEAREAEDAEKTKALGQQLDQAFANARGEIFKILREAQSYAFEKATLAKATGERFASQVKAYEAAPKIYVHEQRLAVLEEALQEGVRKYVVVADANDTQVIIIDLEESATPNLWDLGGTQESSGL